MSGPDSSPMAASTPPTTQPPPRTTRHHTPTLGGLAAWRHSVIYPATNITTIPSLVSGVVSPCRSSLPRPAPGAPQLRQSAAAVEMPHEAVEGAALEVAEEEGAVAEHNLNIFVGPFNIFPIAPNLGLAAEPALAVVPPHLRHAAALGLGELGVASPVPSAVSDVTRQVWSMRG